MKNQTCFFTGHRIIPRNEYTEIQKSLEHVVVKLIHQGVIYYGAGGARGFDMMAALTIIKLKEVFPYIKLILVLPCKEQTLGWNKLDIQTYNMILLQADKIVYTSDHYYNGCLQHRNRHLVDNSGYCICYLIQKSGGTKYTVDCAMKKGLKIIKLP